MAIRKVKVSGGEVDSARTINFKTGNSGLTITAAKNADTGEVDITFNIVEESLIFDRLVLTDGVAAPAATSGQVKVFVDTSGGDLKAEFGDDFGAVILADS